VIRKVLQGGDVSTKKEVKMERRWENMRREKEKKGEGSPY
jgi:hypothetical protein